MQVNALLMDSLRNTIHINNYLSDVLNEWNIINHRLNHHIKIEEYDKLAEIPKRIDWFMDYLNNCIAENNRIAEDIVKQFYYSEYGEDK